MPSSSSLGDGIITAVKPDSATEIVKQLRSHGHEAYFVGGCVRDMVMNIEPADYDIATSALPEEIMKIFPRTEAIGAHSVSFSSFSADIHLKLRRSGPIKLTSMDGDRP